MGEMDVKVTDWKIGHLRYLMPELMLAFANAFTLGSSKCKAAAPTRAEVTVRRRRSFLVHTGTRLPEGTHLISEAICCLGFCNRV